MEPKEKMALLSLRRWWSDPFSPSTLCLLLLTSKALCLFKAHAQSLAAQLSHFQAFHAFRSKNGRTQCVKPAPWEQCALSIALNRQVFSLELFLLWPTTRAPLPQKHMQGAQQVYKEFVKWRFCLIGFVNWDDYSSVANYSINYSSFNSLLPAFSISTCFFLCLLNCFKTSNIIFSLFCNPL